jgi:tetratricopeptide (TPR) repeat protein
VALAATVLGKESDDYSAWLSNLGNMYADKGDLANAERMLRESLAIDRHNLGPGSEDLPISINNLATILVDEGKCADAIPLHEESVAMRRRLFGSPSAELAVGLSNYGHALDCLGRYAEAEAAADSAVAMCETVFGPDHVRTATSRMRLAEVYLHTGRAARAEPLLQSAIQTFRGVGERYWRLGDARATLGETLLALGNPDGIHEMETGWEIFTETTSPDAPRSRDIAGRIAAWYDRAGQLQAARPWHERAAGGSP